MNDSNILDRPKIYQTIQAKSDEIGFTMPSDLYAGSLLRTLVSSKPRANLLEIGTGIGLGLSWMVDGMDGDSRITSIDNDPELIALAKLYFGNDDRIEILCTDGGQWIESYTGEKFDLIFADAWPGKYSHIDEILSLVKIGGLYVIDDMCAQPNWPLGHEDKVADLIAYLEKREDFNLTKMNWSTGLILAVKIK